MILTLEEAKNAIRVTFEDDDELILNLIESIPDYLENKTGLRWDKEPINPLVKTLAKFLLMAWYDQNFEAYEQTIDGLLSILTSMARKEDKIESGES